MYLSSLKRQIDAERRKSPCFEGQETSFPFKLDIVVLFFLSVNFWKSLVLNIIYPITMKVIDCVLSWRVFQVGFLTKSPLFNRNSFGGSGMFFLFDCEYGTLLGPNTSRNGIWHCRYPKCSWGIQSSQWLAIIWVSNRGEHYFE